MRKIEELIRKAYLIKSQINGDKSDIKEIIDWLEDYLERVKAEKDLQEWRDENKRDSGEPWI